MEKQFVFGIDNLLREAEKRTSYLGKMRGTEKEAHLYERMSLTDGERFLSDEYIKEASAETYDWIKAFGRGVDNAFMQFGDGTLKMVRKHFGAGITVGGSNYELGITDYALSSGMVQIANNPQGFFYIDVTLPQVDITIGDAAKVVYRVSLHITVGVQNTPFEEKRVLTQDVTITQNTSWTKYVSQFMYEQSDFGLLVPESIDSIDIEILSADMASASPSQFTEYKGKYAEGDLAFALKDGAWYEPEAVWYEKDIRNSVVYTLEIPEWQDGNMLRKVENNLCEAIINYVVWRWFETVNPSEAAIYYDKWEEKAHGAQLGLNSEKRVLQRRATWF